MRASGMKLLAVFVALLFAVSAASQVKKAEPVQDNRPVVQHLDFLKPLSVVGEPVKPTGAYVRSKPEAKFPLQIKVRGHFLPEIMGSAANL